MELSLVYFAFILFILLSIADPIKYDKQCPTSRRLLLFGGFDISLGEKKTHHKSSSSKPSSPPKYARSSDAHGLTVFIRPQSSIELGHKIRSYSHLLKSKLYTDEEKALLKRLQLEKKKHIKKKNSTQQKPLTTTKTTQELVAINDDELNRCKTLLHIDSTTNNDIKPKKSKKNKSIKHSVSTKVKNTTTQAIKDVKKKIAAAAKTITTTTTALPINEKKIKTIKKNSKPDSEDKKPVKTSFEKTNNNQPVIPPVINKPIKSAASSPPSSSSSIPPPSLQPTTSIKSKPETPKIIRLIQEVLQSFDTNSDGTGDKSDSVVDRAIHFVKNMFQLSDDLLNDNTTPEDQIIDMTNEQQQHHHHHSRKLLTVIEGDEISTIISNDTFDYEFDYYLTNDQPIAIVDDLSFVVTSISKRQLLSVKTNKHPTSSKSTNVKEKKPKTNMDTNKPKVGWAYRYRISRYLDAQKMKRTGNKNRIKGGGKSKQTQQHTPKKPISSSNTKIAKRKLLEYNGDEDDNNDLSLERDVISDQNITNTVTITENFVPKRYLLTTKTKDKSEESTNDTDDLEKAKARRRMKAYEELTDPVAIVQVYEQGLYKPRVGWQFRYRVSRYIDSLRENIREDQERLKLGLQAIKRKTPQELSGRRKRVLDKPLPPDQDESKKQKAKKATAAEEKKPSVGWRYRYRIGKMLDAKKRGKYVDDKEEKRKTRTEQKKKRPNVTKSRIDENLDPELSKINDEGRRVGWAYRYRIRRKLDHLKQQQLETGKPFDLATLGGKREKKHAHSKKNKTISAIEQKPKNKTKSVGWEYRYRVSKMRDAQKREKSKPSSTKKQEPIPVDEQLDPELAKLTPEERTAGWKYRYRIRRKLDSEKNAPSHEHQTGKRTKKSSSKRKNKKIIKKVEESIEKILNIDDIDETPFMEYFRRTSSYILSGLIPTAKKSVCLLPLPIKFSFCNDDNQEKKVPSIQKSKRKRRKKLKTKKEHRAKQFIRNHVTKLGAEDKITERRVDETMKKIYKKPSYPPLQIPPSSENTEHRHTHRRPEIEEQIKHHNEEEKHHITKKIGVESKKNKNKKQFQIIGQKVKVKHKHTTPPLTVEKTETTTSSPRLRSISEVIQEEAATLLAPRHASSRTPEETQANINEANEIIQERAKSKITTTTTPSTLIDSTTSGEEDNDSLSTDDDDNKIHGESVTQNIHDMLNVENKKDSS